MARCPKCGKDSPDQARFCRSCGVALAVAGSGGPGQRPESTPEQRAQRLLEEAFRLSEEGRVAAAIQSCRQAIDINANSVSAHSLLGTLYERQGDRENAIREYEQVLTLSPESTVERRRLNDLMGVPTGREAIALSPRAARVAATGGLLVLAVALVGALVFYTQQGPSGPTRGRRERVARGGAAVQPAVVAQESAPAPGSVFRLGQLSTPARGITRPRNLTPRATEPRTGRDQFGQLVAPGTYILPNVGSGPIYSGRTSGRPTAGAPPTAPLVGAAPYRGTPVVQTPSTRWQQAAAVTGPRSSPAYARERYFRGDYDRAISAYQSYIADNPGAGGAPREELAWVYAESGRRGRALEEYKQALNQYQGDLQRGHNLEAARHGARTCESAIKALEVR